MWDDGHVDFDRLDIPAERVAKILRIVPFSGGDLAYQFCICGRSFHSPSKCMLCKARRKDWLKNRTLGELFKTEDMIADRLQHEELYNNPNVDRVKYPTVDTFIYDYTKNNKTLGSRGLLLLLLPDLPMQQFLLPVLHIMLGIGNDIIKALNTFIESRLEKPFVLDPLAPDANNPKIKLKGKSPIRDRVFKMLSVEFSIMPQKYYTNTLVGGDIHRLLNSHTEICARLRTLLLDPTDRREDVPDNIDTLVGSMVNNMEDLLKVFEVIYAYMSFTIQLSPEQLDKFEHLCIPYGTMWRKYFPEGSITPKMHLLESHAPHQMRLYGCLGDKIEAAIERLHHIVNKSNRILAAVRDFKLKTTTMLDRREVALSPDLQNAIDRAIKGTARLFSPATTVKRTQSSSEKSEAKRMKVDNAIITADLINDFIQIE